MILFMRGTGSGIYAREAQKIMMSTVKHIMSEVTVENKTSKKSDFLHRVPNIRHSIQSQPDDASYEEIMRELLFERMINRGLEDSRKGRVISNEEMRLRICSWQE